MQKSSPWLPPLHAAQRHQMVVRNAQSFAQGAEVLFDQMGREAIMAGRNGRVRREDDLPGHAAAGLLEAQPFALHPLADHFQAGKRAVPFVEMQHARDDAQGPQRLHAADAQQQLLPDPRPLVAAVEPRRQAAILRRISLDVRIEQVRAGCGRR